MNSFNDIIHILKTNKINYWLDQGTLLKYYRDSIIDPEDDIDISILYSNLNELNKSLSGFEKLGYKIRKCFYKNYPFQYKLIPIQTGELMTVDIKIYFENNDEYLWSVKKAVKQSKSKIKRVLIYKIVEKYRNNYRINIDLFPYSFGFDVFTWKIPKTLINKLGDRYNLGVNYPYELGDYLKYHFGDWEERIMRGVWKSYLHDKAITKNDPYSLGFKHE